MYTARSAQGSLPLTAADMATTGLNAPIETGPAATVTSVSPASGRRTGGQSITIRGTNFTGATAVRFSSTPGRSIVVVSATKLTVTTPAHRIGVVNLLVTTPGGTSAAVKADRFTYT